MLEVARLRIHRGGSQLWLKKDILRGLGIRESDRDVPLLLELRSPGILIVKRPSDAHDDIEVRVDG
jgi:hypothetical protein